MALHVDATYENGVLKLDRPVPLEEGDRVQVVILPEKQSWAERTYGLIGWKGDPGVVERIALDPDLMEDE